MSLPNQPAGRPGSTALFTDLYELNMAAVYFKLQMSETATFSLFVRRLPPPAPYLVAAGIPLLVEILESLEFTSADLDWISRELGYDDAFVDALGQFRFSGEIRAIPEGRLAFENEPLVEVTAPITEAQIIETLVINQVAFQTLIASKAARCTHAARGRALMDFGARRSHGTEAALLAARSSALVGFSGTSNLQAAARYGLTPSGTMAHSFVMAFEDESESFRSFARAFGTGAVLLIDTFDTERGARRAADVALELESEGVKIRGVRIDSGDLAEHSKRVRAILDDAGCDWMQIFASGSLDEYRVAALLEQGARIDAFGIGTALDTAADYPYLDIAYKLVRYANRDVFKLSEEKVSLPGPKQVWRLRAGGMLESDVISNAGEAAPGGAEAEGLLVTMMERGRRTSDAELSLGSGRERFARDFAALHDNIKEGESRYPVDYSPELAEFLSATHR